MIFFGRTILPAILIIGAIYLAVAEIVAFPRLKNYGYPEKLLKIRMVRRLAGLFLVCVVAVMMIWGLRYLPGASAGVFYRQASHWAIVMGLVFVIVILAMWDALDGLKYLASLTDQVSKQDLKELEELEKKLRQEKAISATAGEIKRTRQNG